MNSSTKKAVLKAFKIGKILFSLNIDKYNSFIKAVEIRMNDFSSIGSDDDLIEKIKSIYISAARSIGLTEKEGIALLEYTAMMKDIGE